MAVEGSGSILVNIPLKTGPKQGMVSRTDIINFRPPLQYSGIKLLLI